MIYFNNITDFEKAKSQYRKLAKQLHPDKGGSAIEFQQMQVEYKSLLLKFQNKELTINQINTQQSDDILNELSRLAKVLFKTKVPQYFLNHRMAKSKTILERKLYGELIDFLNGFGF